MRVADVMSKHPVVCHTDTSLHEAAGLMWQQDVGLLPVVDEAAQLVGVITDRDALMGAFMTGRHLTEATVGRSMAIDTLTCLVTDSLEKALQVMKTAQIRRLPVVDGAGRPVGILSLNDVIRAAVSEAAGREKTSLSNEVVEALDGIGRPRASDEVASSSKTSSKTTVLPQAEPTAAKKTAAKPVAKKAATKKKTRRS